MSHTVTQTHLELREDRQNLRSLMGKLFSKHKDTATSEPRRTANSPGTLTDMYSGDTTISASSVHRDAVTCLCSLSSTLIASGSKDQSFVVVDITNSQPKVVYRCDDAHEREVTRIVWSQPSDLLLTASRDKSVKAWRKTDEHFVISPAHDLVVTGLDCSSDGKFIVTGSRDNNVKLWDVETRKCLASANISRNLVTFMKWAPNSDMILQASEDKELKLWDSRTLKVSKSFQRKQHIQTCCDIDLSSGLALSCSNGFQGNGCEMTLWDIRGSTLQPLHEFIGHIESIGACAFLKSQMISCSSDQSIRLWDGDSKECIRESHLSGSGPINAICILNSEKFAVGTHNMGISVFEAEDFSRIRMY